MRKTPSDVEIEIALRVLNGESYESAADGRVAKSTVNRIIKLFDEFVPDFWDRRELNIRMRNEGITISDVLRNMHAPVPRIRTVFVEHYIEQNSGKAAQRLEWVLANRWILVPCRQCSYNFPVTVWSAQYYRDLIFSGQGRVPFWFSCPQCGFSSDYTVFEILGFFGLSLLEGNDL